MSLNEGVFVNTIVPKKDMALAMSFQIHSFIVRVDELAMFLVPVGF